MKNIDKMASENIGIPSIVLMENAAICVVNECINYLKDKANKKTIVFCGKGNNGGDGFAIARHLYLKGIDVTIVFIGDEINASNDCRININIIKSLNINIIRLKNENDLRIAISQLNLSELTVDAILGTGINSDLSGIYKSAVKAINSNSKYIISVDCPTGISSDTGEIKAAAVKANKTVTFFLPKLGLILYNGCEYTGELVVADISIPKSLCSSEDIKYNILTKSEAKKILPIRKNNSHKGTYGKGFLFAGSAQMPGACVIAATSMYKTGCGLVNACVTGYVANIIHNNLPEAVTTILSDINGCLCRNSYDDIAVNLNGASSIVIGCGIGHNIETVKFVFKILENAHCPIVIDADALNAVAMDLSILKRINTTAVITPHLGEMSRLTGFSINFIKENLIETAVNFAEKYNVIVLLKDAHSIIARPNGQVYINNTGCSAMAKGGSGDSLAGCIGGFLAQGVKPYDAAILGAYVNGLAGEYCSKQFGSYGSLALDISNSIPFILKQL